MGVTNNARESRIHCRACQPFVEAIQRQFSPLFQEHGFQLLACNEARMGDYCIVLTEGKQCRIRFMLEEGAPSVSFGTITSPMIETLHVGEVQVWYAVEILLAFLEERDGHPRPDVTTDEIITTDETVLAARKTSVEQMLAENWQRLQPYLEELIAAFGPARQLQWWQAYNGYVEKEMRSLGF